MAYKLIITEKAEIDAIVAAISDSCEQVIILGPICRPLKSEAQNETVKDVISIAFCNYLHKERVKSSELKPFTQFLSIE